MGRDNGIKENVDGGTFGNLGGGGTRSVESVAAGGAANAPINICEEGAEGAT